MQSTRVVGYLSDRGLWFASARRFFATPATMAPTSPVKRKKSLVYASFVIFHPESLDPSEISAAVQQLEDIINESTVCDVLYQALQIDFSLEFLLSGELACLERCVD